MFMRVLWGCFLASIFSVQAKAGITEIRVGISEFDERSISAPLSAKRASENSLGINFELLLEETKYLDWALSPKPYLGVTLNLEGKTSFGGAGLLWRHQFHNKIYGDFSFGLVAHTGVKKIPEFQGVSAVEVTTFSGQQRAYNLFDSYNSQIQFGSRFLFREQVNLGFNIDENWSAELFFEHLSNGEILSKYNEGVNIVGFRAAKKL